MLVGWGVGVFVFRGPGWLHLFLTLGVFFVIWHVVLRGTPEVDARGDRAAPRSARPR